MRALVVYESMYGNTRVVAGNIADGLRAGHDVILVPVAEATGELLAWADLVIVGGPTHMHLLSTAASRRLAAQAAATQASGLKLDPEAGGPGLRDLLGSQLLHVVEHENDTQGRRDAQNRLVQQMMLLGVEQVAFGALSGILEQQPQLFIARHQLVEREHVRRGMGSLASHAPAPVSGDCVKPDGQFLRVLYLGQVLKGTEEHFLHGVFGIFRLPADLHAEGIDCVLKQPDRLFNRFRGVEAQQICGLYQFRSHRMGSSRSIPVYPPRTRKLIPPEGPPAHRAKHSEMDSLYAGMRSAARLQSCLNHLQADRGYLLQPVSFLVACRL